MRKKDCTMSLQRTPQPIPPRIPKNGRVGVLGAGISGLSFAYFLSKLRPDIRITIFERGSQTGGWIDTTELVKEDNTVIKLEKGPRTLRGVSDGTLVILDILESLGYKDQILAMRASSPANRKYLLSADKEIIPLPHSIKSFLKFSGNGILTGLASSVIREPFRAKGASGDESIEAFFKRRLGNTNITNNLLSAIIHGIYAGNTSSLSINSIFPKVKGLEQQEGSIVRAMIKSLFKKQDKAPQLGESLVQYEEMISKNTRLASISKSLLGHPIVAFKDTLSIFPKVLTEYLLKNPNIEFVYDSKIVSLDPDAGTIATNDSQYTFDHIRSTINVNSLASVLVNAPELKQECEKIEYVSIFMANVFSFTKGLIPESGFGFLVPKAAKNQEFLLGTIYDSEIASHVYPLGSDKKSDPADHSNMTLMIGGHFYENNIPSTALSIKAVKRSLKDIFGINTDKIIFRDEAEAPNKRVTLKQDDVLVSYSLHKDCIPQYNVGYEEIKSRVNAMEDKLSLGGMCFGRGVGVPDCVMNSLESALKLSLVY